MKMPVGLPQIIDVRKFFDGERIAKNRLNLFQRGFHGHW
jgi:hypothetical protein